MRRRLQRALFYLPYGRLPDRFVDPGPLGTEEIFCCQCRVDGSFDGRFPFVRQQGSAICLHRFGRIWQFERLLHPFLSGFIVDAPTAERSIRLDDYGTFRWNGLPFADGSGQRCRRSEWSCCRNECRSDLFDNLYIEIIKK